MENLLDILKQINLVLPVIALVFELIRSGFIKGRLTSTIFYYNKFRLLILVIIFFSASAPIIYNINKLNESLINISVIPLIVLFTIFIIGHISVTQIKGARVIKSNLKGVADYKIYELDHFATRKSPSGLHKSVSDLENFKTGKILLKWETFGIGMEYLERLIEQATGIEPNIYFGINEAGLIIASFLSNKNRIPVGIIKTRGVGGDDTREIIQFDKPSITDAPNCIAIVDSEIKTGKSIKGIHDYLHNEYTSARIVYIVLCAVLKNGQKDIELERFGDCIDVSYKPNFVAYYVNEPGIEPPGQMR